MAGCSDKWLPNLNPNKCHILTIGKQKKENELVNISEEKDLGEIIDNKFKFKTK